MYYRVSGNHLVRSSDSNPVELPASVSLADLQAADYEFEAAEKEAVKVTREDFDAVAVSANLSAQQIAALEVVLGFQPKA
jgi:hypothetical protein